MERTYAIERPAHARAVATIKGKRISRRLAAFVVCDAQPLRDQANLDDGSMWPTSYALTGPSEANEAAITELVKKAAG